MSGFERQQRTVSVAPTQVLPVDVTMGLAGVSETVEVVGRAADVLTQTAQVATNFPQELIANLPTTRDINSTLLLAPAVHSTGPGGNYSIAGSMSYENLFMINGVSVNENIRGTAFNLYIEDAIQETTISTAGISAEYGRFGGGVVNVITKSGGNTFSGSFRDTLNNDKWRALVPKRDGDLFANDTKLDKLVPTYEYTVRRSDPPRSPLVLHGRSIPDAGIVPEHRGHEHSLSGHQQVAALRGQRHLLARTRTTGSRARSSRRSSIS